MIPPELIQLGTAGIIALALWVVTLTIKPLIAGFVANQRELAAVNRELLAQLKASNGVIDRNSDALQRSVDETQEMRLALTTLAGAQTALVKSLPETMAGIMRGDEVLAARLDAHDAQAREGIARVEAKLAAIEGQMTNVLAKIESGHLSRAEIARQFREVMDAIASLRPVPPLDPPPAALRLVPDKAAAEQAEDDEQEKAA